MDLGRFDDDEVRWVKFTGDPIGDGLARQDAASLCVDCGKRIADMAYRGAGCQTVHEACYQRSREPRREGRYASGVVATLRAIAGH